MLDDLVDRLVYILTGRAGAWSLIWLALAFVTFVLLVLMRTRWGQSRPIHKCAVLSLLVHVLIGMYATTVQIISTGAGRAPSTPIYTVVLNEGDEALVAEASQTPAWETFADAASTVPDFDVAERLPTDSLEPPAAPTLDPLPAPSAPQPGIELSTPPPAPVSDLTIDTRALLAPLTPTVDNASLITPALHPATPIDAPSPAPPLAAIDQSQTDSSATSEAQRQATSALDAPPPTLVDPLRSLTPENALPGLTDYLPARVNEPDTSFSATAAPRMQSAASASASALPASDRSSANAGGSSSDVTNGTFAATPDLYRLRTADRALVARQHGGSSDTEAAVAAALKWLARNQNPDGRWDASAHGAGIEQNTLGHNRGGAGREADTGVTGLALLAFLAAGHTHMAGDYQDTVARGLDFLLASQGADGSLGGNADLYAYMYCHGMATIAISEALAMTGDERLRPAVRRAVAYTVEAQHPSSGGWRYLPWRQRPSDYGDASQLGWQLMALKSAEMAGVPTPANTKQGIRRFLQNVTFGKYGGLASYQPGERQSRSMTAEALACRQFLGLRPDDPLAAEAAEYILQEKPGDGAMNFYYWYYGTLAMYQLQGDAWERWNSSLTRTLLRTQRGDGDLAGSWDVDVWGGYGGRVYTTALATLSLEVYYRYLPLHAEVAGEKPAIRR